MHVYHIVSPSTTIYGPRFQGSVKEHVGNSGRSIGCKLAISLGLLSLSVSCVG